MIDKQTGLQMIEETRIIAIVRGVSQHQILHIAESLLAGGITVMEVTLNTDNALDMIRNLKAKFSDQMYIGAGTVLDLEDAQQALDAGASFIVTPNTEPEVIRYAVEQDIPIFPGAMTPTEVIRAWKSGATAVKIFPSASLGISYLKELQGPLKHIPMIAVGGIREENIADYLRLGCYAVGIGGSLISLEQLENGNDRWIRDKAKALVERVRSVMR